MTPQGLYCPAGNFYIDPSRGVEHAVVTHGHSDHARRGATHYYCASSGVGILKARLGKNITVHGKKFNEDFYFKGVKVSFHPAGHILGSAQVRLEQGGEVWVASGDYKREPDPSCEPFEPVPCDVFVTEATFGTPAYVWNKSSDVAIEILNWWNENSKNKINSILFGYSLGKTQRILGMLHRLTTKPIYCHSAAAELNSCYLAEGIKLAKTICLSEIPNTTRLVGELVIAPQSFMRSEQAQILGDKFVTAFASGWMAKSTYGYDRGFLISDHADWNDLIKTIKETNAKKVFVQHRGKGALVRHLKTLGIQAFPDTALFPQNPNQLDLF